MDATVVEVLEAHGDAIYECVERAHARARAFWTSSEEVGRLPDLEFSGLVTNIAKLDILATVPAVTKVPGPAAVLEGTAPSGTVTFRLHRARLRAGADPNDFEAEDILSPSLNGVSTGTRPDFLLVWISEGDELRGIYAVAPRGKLDGEEGTQRATYAKVRGRRWRWSYQLERPAVTTAASSPSTPMEMPVQPVEADVDLGIEPDEDQQDVGTQRKSG